MRVHIVQYRWAGSWGPFRITTPCGECTASRGIIRHTIEAEFPHEPVMFEERPWLNHWWRALLRGGWHAPITTVNGHTVAQGEAVDRGLLAYHIRKELVKGYELPRDKNIVFSKPNCTPCNRAKTLLEEHGIPYEDREIITNPLYAHQLFHVAKQLFPHGKPITTPQVWLAGTHIGGADDLAVHLAAR